MYMSDNYTISETFTLPSLGKVYSTPINPEITLRSMTTRDEMRRLSPSENIYKPLCDMIEGCIVGDKPKVHVYDMCLGDYQFLLHKLRVVTYGSDYKMKVRCPNCGEISDGSTDLNDETVLEWDDSILDLLNVTLPKTGIKLSLKFATPRMMDEIQKRKKEILRKTGEQAFDPTLSLTAQALIDTVDGERLNPVKLETFVDNLNAYDLKYFMSMAAKFNERVGIDTQVIVKCSHCGYDVVTTFRLEPGFFEPQV